jgi:hypothetical protein
MSASVRSIYSSLHGATLWPYKGRYYIQYHPNQKHVEEKVFRDLLRFIYMDKLSDTKKTMQMMSNIKKRSQ